eukprot:1161670-Pelagomonas_calceolata.AAC.27
MLIPSTHHPPHQQQQQGGHAPLQRLPVPLPLPQQQQHHQQVLLVDQIKAADLKQTSIKKAPPLSGSPHLLASSTTHQQVQSHLGVHPCMQLPGSLPAVSCAPRKCAPHQQQQRQLLREPAKHKHAKNTFKSYKEHEIQTKGVNQAAGEERGGQAKREEPRSQVQRAKHKEHGRQVQEGQDQGSKASGGNQAVGEERGIQEQGANHREQGIQAQGGQEQESQTQGAGKQILPGGGRDEDVWDSQGLMGSSDGPAELCRASLQLQGGLPTPDRNTPAGAAGGGAAAGAGATAGPPPAEAAAGAGEAAGLPSLAAAAGAGGSAEAQNNHATELFMPGNSKRLLTEEQASAPAPPTKLQCAGGASADLHIGTISQQRQGLVQQQELPAHQQHHQHHQHHQQGLGQHPLQQSLHVVPARIHEQPTSMHHAVGFRSRGPVALFEESSPDRRARPSGGGPEASEPSLVTMEGGGLGSTGGGSVQAKQQQQQQQEQLQLWQKLLPQQSHRQQRQQEGSEQQQQQQQQLAEVLHKFRHPQGGKDAAVAKADPCPNSDPPAAAAAAAATTTTTAAAGAASISASACVSHQGASMQHKGPPSQSVSTARKSVSFSLLPPPAATASSHLLPPPTSHNLHHRGSASKGSRLKWDGEASSSRRSGRWQSRLAGRTGSVGSEPKDDRGRNAAAPANAPSAPEGTSGVEAEDSLRQQKQQQQQQQQQQHLPPPLATLAGLAAHRASMQ